MNLVYTEKHWKPYIYRIEIAVEELRNNRKQGLRIKRASCLSKDNGSLNAGRILATIKQTLKTRKTRLNRGVIRYVNI